MASNSRFWLQVNYPASVKAATLRSAQKGLPMRVFADGGGNAEWEASVDYDVRTIKAARTFAARLRRNSRGVSMTLIRRSDGGRVPL